MIRFVFILLMVLSAPAHADDVAALLNKRLVSVTASDNTVTAAGQVTVTHDKKTGNRTIDYPALLVRGRDGDTRIAPSRLVIAPDNTARVTLPDTITHADGRVFRLNGQNITGTWVADGAYIGAIKGVVNNIAWSNKKRGGAIKNVMLDFRVTDKTDKTANLAFSLAGGAVTTTSVMNKMPGADGILPKKIGLRGTVVNVPRDFVMLGFLAPLAGRAAMGSSEGSSNTELVLDAAAVETGSGLVANATGRLRPDMMRPDGVTGELNTRWRNLDRLGPEGQEPGVRLVAGLITMLGVRQGDETALALEFMPGGGVRFNGRDMASMLGGLAPMIPNTVPNTAPNGTVPMDPGSLAPFFNPLAAQNPVDSGAQNP